MLSDLNKRNQFISQKINEINDLIIDFSLKKENIERQNFKFLSKKSSDDSWGLRIRTLQESIR